ncbi:MAG: glycosyltransferase family 2 protein [Planctomycetales bacterium]|nr:glycosyltransferase family 2 protein [Planctomycetales bacterium]
MSRLQSLPPDSASKVCELSVVIPCLNEAETLGICLEKANRVLREHGVCAEVIVADNGSMDESIAIANEHGARVVAVAAKGYGNALMGGIEASRGRYVLMGDADDSYDFLEIPRFLAKLREGYDLVQGCRLPTGGGRILPGAMPLLHRVWGNPMFSFLVRRLFHAPIHDVYCGMRGFTRSLYNDLNLRCTGMEFATEMIIKSSVFGRRIAEVPITLHPDGRRQNRPHLRTFRDGWRTLRFFLMYSPRWLFLLPGLLLVLFGMLGYVAALPALTIFGATVDAHTLLVASMAILLGFQLTVFALITKTFAVVEKLVPADPRLDRFFKIFKLEHGLLAGALGMAAGFALIALAANQWRLAEFGPLEYARTMRLVIPGVTAMVLGGQLIASSFFVSMLGINRR